MNTAWRWSWSIISPSPRKSGGCAHVSRGYRAQLAYQRFLDTLKYRPDQPRDDWGRWIYDGGRRTRPRAPDDRIRLAQNTPRGGRGSGLGGARGQDATLPQQGSLFAVRVDAARAIRCVNELDPNWRPTPSLLRPLSVEDEINNLRGIAAEAQTRLVELASRPPESLIGAYRTRYHQRDLFGRDTWPAWKGTVAVGRIDNMPVFGVNSSSPAYLAADRSRAAQMRSELIQFNPDIAELRNICRKPYDALYHAEATVLLRAASLNRGSLFGRDIEITVDRQTCDSCGVILPYVGLRIGNPTVTSARVALGEQCETVPGRTRRAL